MHCSAVKSFGHWLSHSNATLIDINEETIKTYIEEIKQIKKTCSAAKKATSALPHLLNILRSRKLIPKQIQSPVMKCDFWLSQLDEYFSQVIGLSIRTRQKYCYYIKQFLFQYCGDDISNSR